MAVKKNSAEPKAPRMSAIERAEKLLAAAKEKEAERVAKVKDADILTYAKAKVAYDKAEARLAAATKTLVEVHGFEPADLESVEVAEIVAAAPKPKAKDKSEPEA